ncbi:sensor histidine kinase [Ideonella sp. YS5]|uniref:sensor histidine kinase n=1 Tax=Ideonella sp. YS5 TaxID=3453714 RepID=UPI003EEC237F
MTPWIRRPQAALGGRDGPDAEASRQSALEELAAARAMLETLSAQHRLLLQEVDDRNLFLANLSHELRAPLNSIIGFADVLVSGTVPPASPKGEHFLRNIQASGQHLLQLLDDALEMSRLDAGRYEFLPRPVDLEDLIAQVIDLLHTRIVRKSLEIAVDVDGRLSGIVADPVRLKQALMGYLGHAVQFTPEGGRIGVRAWPQDAERYRLEVEDPGPAIPPEEAVHVFAGLTQAGGSMSERAQSIGLSFALTRRLVEAQGGEVGMRSAPGAGTAFFLVMDRVQATRV